MQMRTIEQWLEEYSASHQNQINKLIHWICVPAIALCVLGFASMIKLPTGNLMHVVILLALLYYFYLSPKLAVGMLFVSILGIFAVQSMNSAATPAWQIYTFIFVVAWIGQFIGHKIEGMKPSFFKDVQFLLIGPLWLLSFAYKKLNIHY